MRVTITVERDATLDGSAEVHCSVKLGNGYVDHEQILKRGERGSVTFNIDETRKPLARTATLEVTPIT